MTSWVSIIWEAEAASSKKQRERVHTDTAALISENMLSEWSTVPNSTNSGYGRDPF